ncbi:hypothetical protein L226DRAFT_526446 [Lentinus tigrinus ALCF2SS1-7]|uniref:uncharacterized protein n=1 Tax=Lentinus tigrinus ALCF2SS1-7 TaxID=1328758 RepID=UPI0011661256|nr:hypothetical protein L226DRAFT_526446 [Lentinus tigrinus ALCF2SS1-7]
MTDAAHRHPAIVCHNGAIKARDYKFTALKYGRHIESNAVEIERKESELSAAERVLACKELAVHFWKEVEDLSWRKVQLVRQMRINKNCFLAIVPLVWGNLNKDIFMLLQLLDLDYFNYGGNRKRRSGQEYLEYIWKNASTIVKSSMWPKFLHYAQFVRSVQINTAVVTPGTFEFLSSLITDGSSLLCGMRQIEWSEACASNNDLLCLVAPPLERLSLETFDFHDCEDSSEAFSAWVLRTCVKTVTVAPGLRYMGIQAFRTLDLSIALKYFTSLHVLEVTRINLQSSDEVPPPEKFANFQEFQLSSHIGSSAMFHTLTLLCAASAHTLRKVNLQSLASRYYPEAPDLVDHVKCLFDVPGLEHIILNFPEHQFRFTDSHLRMMADAWPLLRFLGVSFETEPNHPIPELPTLGYVTTRCTRLCSITIPAWNATRIWNGDCKIDAPSNHPLEEIRADRVKLPTGHEFDVVKVLEQAFPKLKSWPGA